MLANTAKELRGVLWKEGSLMAQYTREERALYNSAYTKLRSMIYNDATIDTAFKEKLNYSLEQGFPIDYVPTKKHRPLLFAALQRHQDNDAIEILLDTGQMSI